MDKLMKELGSFVDSALAGAGGKESVKIVAMHGRTRVRVFTVYINILRSDGKNLHPPPLLCKMFEFFPL